MECCLRISIWRATRSWCRRRGALSDESCSVCGAGARGDADAGGVVPAGVPGLVCAAGNYGALLSQAMAVASAVRGDSAGIDLAQPQLQWVVRRNRFVPSTKYGEGYDRSRQYSVLSGEFVGSLPVGCGAGGSYLPYWSDRTSTSIRKFECTTSRWIWIMKEMIGQPPIRRAR
jgi:hypothetical protein